MTKRTKRYRSHEAKQPMEVFGNRAVTAASTIGIGGSLGACITHYAHVPEELHAHAIALVVFFWQTAVYLVTFWWRKRYGG